MSSAPPNVSYLKSRHASQNVSPGTIWYCTYLTSVFSAEISMRYGKGIIVMQGYNYHTYNALVVPREYMGEKHSFWALAMTAFGGPT